MTDSHKGSEKMDKDILKEMARKVAEYHSTEIENVEFPQGLKKQTEWGNGCDYSAEYNLRDASFTGFGQVYWSFVSQLAYL